jgi:hypothetical protein
MELEKRSRTALSFGAVGDEDGMGTRGVISRWAKEMVAVISITYHWKLEFHGVDGRNEAGLNSGLWCI